jgi:hypothetical protein
LGDGAFKYTSVATDGSLSALSESTRERISVDNPDKPTFEKMIMFHDSLLESLEAPSTFQYQFVEEFTNSAQAVSRLQLSRVLWSQIWVKRKIILDKMVREISSRIKS